MSRSRSATTLLGRIVATSAAAVLTAGVGAAVAAGPAQAADGPCSRTDNIWFICKTYTRGSTNVHLRYGIEYRGNGGWGYDHIKATRGWSTKLDSYIRITIATGTPAVNPTNKKTYITGNPGNEPGCKFTVVNNTVKLSYEPAARAIETAYGNGLCSIN